MAEQEKYMFSSTLDPQDVTKFTLMRGVTDFSNLKQWDLYETGYSFLVCLQIPEFMKIMSEGQNSTKYKNLVDGYRHILEYDFRGAQGIEDMSTETNALTNGINELNMITKVNEQAGSTFTMNYFERSGSLMTKFNEAYLRGIKDPRTQVKRYNGLLTWGWTPAIGSTDDKSSKNMIAGKGFQYEIFHFLLIVTDNTALNVEKAYILASCQPNMANTSIYNVTRGEIQFSELSLQFNGFPISGRIVNEKAREFLKWINANTCFDEMEFGYNILTDDTKSRPENGDWVASPTEANGYKTDKITPSSN